MLENKFNGDVEAYKAYMRDLGRKGGSVKVPKGRNYKKNDKKSV